MVKGYSEDAIIKLNAIFKIEDLYEVVKLRRISRNARRKTNRSGRLFGNNGADAQDEQNTLNSKLHSDGI